MEKKALILDFDNTLYSWMEAYAPSFLAQINYLEKETAVSKEVLKRNFKEVFKKYDSVEIPDAVFELSIWKQTSISDEILKDILVNSQRIFFNKFEESICLFPNVEETLKWALDNSILIFGFSDAFSTWIDYRLKCLSIERYFTAIFAVEDEIIFNSKVVQNSKKGNNIVAIPKKYTKPDTFVIEEIISTYGIEREKVYLVGDSIEKDVFTAKKASVNDIWAKYGTIYRRGYGGLLKSITPWTKSMQLAEDRTKKKISPSYTIVDFKDLKCIIK